MMDINKTLPHFKKPPVIETVLGFYFRPLEKFTSAHQGLLWDRYFREKFPKLEERQPVEEVFERFGEERLAMPMIRWQVHDRPDAPRLWASSENGRHVIQIQKNALFVNWLKADAETAYHPYQERREEFNRQLNQVIEFFRKENIGQLKPTTWIVTYINHIDFEGFNGISSAVANILEVWVNQRSDNWLPEPDKVVLDFAFPMPEKSGRLNVKLMQVAQSNDKKQFLRLDLTARGQLKNENENVVDALAGIDSGHEWVVRGFTSLTTREMHKVWELMQ